LTQHNTPEDLNVYNIFCYHFQPSVPIEC
jgi:hypothetical protein